MVGYIPWKKSTSNTCVVHTVFITSTLHTYCTRTHIIQYNEEAIVNPKKITSLFSVATKNLIFWCPCCHCTIHYSMSFAHVRRYNNTTHYLNVLQWSRIFLKCAWIWIRVVFRPSLDIPFKCSSSLHSAFLLSIRPM